MGISWQYSGWDPTLSLLRAQFNPWQGNKDSASHTVRAKKKKKKEYNENNGEIDSEKGLITI